MYNKTLFIISIVFLLVISISFADISYNESGEFDTSYTRGSGLFNAQLSDDEITVTSFPISNPKKVPLVTDLDNDGIQEIIVLDGRNLLVFQGTALNLIDTFQFPVPTDERFSNMIVFDIDGDSFAEVIIAAENTELLFIMNFTGSTIDNKTTIDFTTLGHSSGSDAGQITLGCESTNRCLMAYANEQDTGFTGFPDNTVLFASYFNSTFIGNEITLDTSASNTMHCAPKIRTMAKTNYDSQVDSDIEFLFSYSEPSIIISGDDEVSIYAVNVLANNSPVLEPNFPITTTEVGDIIVNSNTAADIKCDNSNSNLKFSSAGGFGTPLPEKLFTSPLVFDADPSKAGEEIIIGIMVDNSAYKMIMYENDGTEIDEFPEAQEGNGQIISNIFRAEIFPDSSSRQDFCIVAQDSNVQRIDVICASKQADRFGLLLLDNIEFRSNASLDPFAEFGLPFNISDDFDFHGIISHSVEVDQENSQSEILTGYGTFETEIQTGIFTNCFLFGFCPLNLLFNTPQQDGAIIPVDLLGTGEEDWLILTDLNLFYVDDGFTNAPVSPVCGEPGAVPNECTIININPCLDSPWDANTTVQIEIIPDDPEGDLVSTRARIYQGTFNEQDSGFINVSTGQVRVISTNNITGTPFIANQTGSGFTLLVEISDIVNNPTVIESLTKTFDVVINGVETFDCTSRFDDDIIPRASGIGEDCSLDSDCNSGQFCNAVGVCQEEDLLFEQDDPAINPFSNACSALGGILGLSCTTIWLIIMISLSAGIWIYGSMSPGFSGSTALGVIAILNLLMIVLGARLNILSSSLVIIITVLGVVIIGIFLGKLFTGVGARE